MSKHTPTPIMYRATRDVSGTLRLHADGKDAEFIVRAVNAHDALVSALELLLHHEAILDDDDPRLIQTRAECHAALKLAKGE